MMDVVKTVNFQSPITLNRREFCNFLNKSVSDYDDVIYFTFFHWLNIGKVLKEVFELKNEIYEFAASTYIISL